MGTLGLVFLLFPGPLVRMVTSEPRLLEMAIPLLRICGPAQIFLGTSMVLDQAIRGAGDTRPAMLIVTASIFLLRVPAAYLIGVASCRRRRRNLDRDLLRNRDSRLLAGRILRQRSLESRQRLTLLSKLQRWLSTDCRPIYIASRLRGRGRIGPRWMQGCAAHPSR